MRRNVLPGPTRDLNTRASCHGSSSTVQCGGATWHGPTPHCSNLDTLTAASAAMLVALNRSLVISRAMLVQQPKRDRRRFGLAGESAISSARATLTEPQRAAVSARL
jgi:hypothetical protein